MWPVAAGERWAAGALSRPAQQLVCKQLRRTLLSPASCWSCRASGRPTMLGKAARGKASPAKPLHRGRGAGRRRAHGGTVQAGVGALRRRGQGRAAGTTAVHGLTLS